MANLYFTARRGELVTGTVAKTMLLIKAPANHRLRISGWKIVGKGTNPNQTPVLAEIVSGQSDFGTLATGGYPGLKHDPSQSETVQTAVYVNAATPATEPAGGNVLFSDEVPPAGGCWEKHFPKGEGPEVAGGGYFGIRLTADTNTTFICELYVEE